MIEKTLTPNPSPSGASRGRPVEDFHGGVPRTIVRRMPEWLKRPLAFTGKKAFVEERIAALGLHTVCVEAKCPNRGECHAKGAATFLILGNVCTRHCGFCNVSHGAPKAIDPDEPSRLCEAASRMGLRHVVVTSVTRDDLPDGGAAMFSKTVHLLKSRIPKVTVELLIPDFNGNEKAYETVIKSEPDIFGHNVETVPRLYAAVRPGASFERSLHLLARAARSGRPFKIKSGLMAGLGESPEEIEAVMLDLRKGGCSIVTIGQYLRPSAGRLPIVEFVNPKTFERLEKAGRAMGFDTVLAGPYVRSSYRAFEIFENGDNYSRRLTTFPSPLMERGEEARR